MKIEMLGVHLIGIIKVVFKQLCDQHQMLLVIKEIMQSEQVGFISVTISRNKPQ